jgi:hypothetical protein
LYWLSDMIMAVFPADPALRSSSLAALPFPLDPTCVNCSWRSRICDRCTTALWLAAQTWLYAPLLQSLSADAWQILARTLASRPLSSPVSSGCTVMQHRDGLISCSQPCLLPAGVCLAGRMNGDAFILNTSMVGLPPHAPLHASLRPRLHPPPPRPSPADALSRKNLLLQRTIKAILGRLREEPELGGSTSTLTVTAGFNRRSSRGAARATWQRGGGHEFVALQKAAVAWWMLCQVARCSTITLTLSSISWGS